MSCVDFGVFSVTKQHLVMPLNVQSTEMDWCLIVVCLFESKCMIYLVSFSGQDISAVVNACSLFEYGWYGILEFNVPLDKV